jgi:2-polyprenyl-3-methyl-5-hydroxy-6-metoxy-1,4-benzoquinol methylase
MRALLYSEVVESLSVDDMYGDWQVTEDQVRAELTRSLNPRSSDSLFDIVESLGIRSGATILDVGARDARHSVTLHQRLGCDVVAVEPVADNVEAALKRVDDMGYHNSIDVRRGTVEDIPVDSETFDLVFCRDVLSHLDDLRTALKECGRVTVTGGWMVIYQTFATDHLEPMEKARLCADLAVAPVSLDTDNFEAAVADSPFVVESTEVIGSEWREHWEEDGTMRTSQQLLHAARLIRNGDEIRSRLGEIPYRVELANALWGIYQMIGKLEPRIYTLRKVSQSRPQVTQ